MRFHESIEINRPPIEVFGLLRDKDQHWNHEESKVLALEKVSPGPHQAGTRYREVVQMLPGVKGEIHSEITCYQPPGRLEERFWGAGMKGYLAYRFEPAGNGTRLVQIETIEWQGALKLLTPLIKLTLGRAIRQRLVDIKTLLESGELAAAAGE